MNLDDRILFGLEQVTQALQLLLERESRSLALSSLQMRILQALWSHPLPQRVGSLARRLGVTPATVSDAVRVLHEKNLLTKKRSSEDGRTVVLTLTPRGKEAALSGGRVGEALREKISLLPEEERKTFLQSLINLIRTLLEGGLIPVDRMCIDCHFFQPDFYPDSEAPHLCSFVGGRFEGKKKSTCLGSFSRPSKQAINEAG
ncbi:MAG: winged helix-turn-helix transcriptional regulator [Nitrospirae bacterium]|nr:winged helix-turn-helix transcriptional regulator [Nitrospirota bacterium]